MKRICQYFCFLITAQVVLQSCCDPCEKPDYGQFPLTTAGVSKMGFSNLGEKIFVSSNGEKKTLTYFESINTLQSGTYDCEIDRRCGICCANFEGGLFYSQLADENNTTRFEFSLTKDFSRHSPLEPSDSISEILNLSFNTTQITGQIEDVVNTSLEETVELDGRTFNNVKKIETTIPPVFNDPTVLINFYFSYSQGVVGFQYADSTIWRLE